MIDEIQSLLEQYRIWLRDKTSIRQVNDWVQITTPYMDRHNDLLQIYAKRSKDGFLLTDDGYILDDLEQSGCRMEGNHRLGLLTVTLNGFGVRREGNELQVQVSRENFAQRKHNLLQAMLAVNDLFYLAQPRVENLFYDDVVGWLDKSEIRYVANAKFTGASGYDHLFQFSIPKSTQQPERILRTINRPTREQAQIAAFSWIDIREVRPEGARAYAILNDFGRKVSPNVLEAMQSYEVRPIVWSEREQVREELAA